MEAYATGLALSSRVESFTSYGKSSESSSGLNRHVMNLLSTAPSYIDQVKGDFHDAGLSPPFKETATTRLSEAYDAPLQYRLLESLRNHVQHSSLPVHKVAPDRESLVWAKSVAFYSRRSEIDDAGRGGFHARVWNEIKGFVEYDLRKASRGYVGSLSEVHVDLRAIVMPRVLAARGTFLLAIDRYHAAGASTALGLCAFAPPEVGEKPVPILLEWFEVLMNLAKKNERAITLEGPGPDARSMRWAS